MGEMLILNANTDYDLSSAAMHAMFENAREAGLPEGLVGRLRHAQAELDAVAERFDTSQATARKDLRPEAYSRWIADATEQAATDIERIARPMITELQEQAAELQARLVPKPSKRADEVALVVEYRSRLRLLDALVVQEHYLEACRTRDGITIAACEDAPKWDPLITPEARAAGRRIVAELDAPDAVSMLDTVERVLGALESAVRACRRHCEVAARLEGFEPDVA